MIPVIDSLQGLGVGGVTWAWCPREPCLHPFLASRGTTSLASNAGSTHLSASDPLPPSCEDLVGTLGSPGTQGHPRLGGLESPLLRVPAVLTGSEGLDSGVFGGTVVQPSVLLIILHLPLAHLEPAHLPIACVRSTSETPPWVGPVTGQTQLGPSAFLRSPLAWQGRPNVCLSSGSFCVASPSFLLPLSTGPEVSRSLLSLELQVL